MALCSFPRSGIGQRQELLYKAIIRRPPNNVRASGLPRQAIQTCSPLGGFVDLDGERPDKMCRQCDQRRLLGAPIKMACSNSFPECAAAFAYPYRLREPIANKALTERPNALYQRRPQVLHLETLNKALVPTQ